jgi:glycosyltransferase involved in cell wall biosynthesis
MNQMPVVLDTRVVNGTGGGPDKTILNSPRFLAAAGYKNLCAYMHPPGDPGFRYLRQKARAWQAPLLSVPDAGPLDWSVIPRLLEICRRERVAIWHGHDYKSNALGIILQRFWPMRLVTTVHGWVKHTRRTPLYYKIDKLCLRHYDTVICVSEDLHEECLASGVPLGRCVLVENGIDLDAYTRKLSLEQAKRSLHLAPDQFVIRAVDQLIRGGLDVQLLLVGDGDQKDALQALIAELGRANRIRLFGYRPDATEIYQAMDVFALSSHREGLPNVLLEAMALEVPVVATRIAGIPRVIQDGQNGLLVDPGASAGLAQALARLLGDAELRARLRQAGRRTVEARYSFAARMHKVGALYDELLNRPRAERAASKARADEPVMALAEVLP